MKFLTSSFILLMSISSIKFGYGTYLERPVEVDEDEIVYKKYLETDKMLKEFINYGVKSILPYLLEANEHLNVSSNCIRDTFQLLNNIRKLKLSAFKFLDATGKPPEGLFEGNINIAGDYDECLNTSVLKRDGTVAFRGQYCMIYMKPLLPKENPYSVLGDRSNRMEEAMRNASELMKFIITMVPLFYNDALRFGACVPSGCTADDMRQMLNYIGGKVDLNATVAYCDTEEDHYITLRKMISMGMFSLIGLITLVGTIIENYCKEKNIVMTGRGPQILMCFSITRNFPKLIDTKVFDKSLSCLQGIRVLSLFNIILLHQYYFQGWLAFQDHMLQGLNQAKYFFWEIVGTGFLTSEIFFFIGGLLNCYSRLKIKEAGKSQPGITKLIIHRLWRMYPAYIFTMFLMYLFSAHGPMTTRSKKDFAAKCDEHLWKNLIFINNFFHQKDCCLPHSWYIAADFQLFLLSLFTVPLLLKNARKGLFLNLAVLWAGIICSFTWGWYENIQPAIIFHNADKEKIMKLTNLYQTFLPHISSYFTGILVGYYLNTKKELKLSKGLQLVGWLVASLTFTSMLFLPHRWNAGASYTRAGSALYFAFSRFLYAAAVAWMVVCCSRGYGGIINYILSLKVWIPLSRMSYMVYLTSPILQLLYFSNLKTPTDAHRMVVIWRYMGDITLSCLLGLAMVVITESPFISMEKIFFQRNPNKETKYSGDQGVEHVKKVDNENKNSTVVEMNLKNSVAHIQLKQ